MVRLPKILTSGLWSVTMTKLSQPYVKHVACSKTQATANASFSTGAYLFLANDKNLDPDNITRLSELQQPEFVMSQTFPLEQKIAYSSF